MRHHSASYSKARAINRPSDRDKWTQLVTPFIAESCEAIMRRNVIMQNISRSETQCLSSQPQ